MGMLAYLKRVPPSVIPQCLKDSEFSDSYILGSQPDTETLCLKESWDGLHYVLSPNRRRPAKELDTMVIWDAGDLLAVGILGKNVLNRSAKFGFTVPKWIGASEVADIAKELSKVHWESAAEEIVYEKMSRCGVYPDGLWDDERVAVKFLKYWFLRLRAFYETASRQEQAVISYLKL